MKCVIGAALLVVFALLFGPEPAGAQIDGDTIDLVLYVAPVREEVIDPFRPPAHVGAPGNRGLLYQPPRGRYVGAAADGRVFFAGQVAGRGVVSINHDDGVRTTYSGLVEIWVHKDEVVRQGEAVATAQGGGFHFGARVGDHYLDPQILIDASLGHAPIRLLPPPDS